MFFNPQPKKITIRLKGPAYTEFRKKVYNEYGGICAECGDYAPLLRDGVFDLYGCGHVSHKKGHGAGGGDVIENVEWRCSRCHLQGLHGPRWSKGVNS